MISFKNVDFSYGQKTVLKNFNMQINKGDRVCLSGESGIGKTTVLRLIMGLEKVECGQLTVEENLKKSAVFQDDRLLPFKTVAENIALFGDADLGLKILKEMGLSEVADKYPATLSGGMARRVSIARALAASGEIYIFDEPFNGIDEENVKQTAAIINRQTQGKTVIMVSHNKRDMNMLLANEIKM